MHLLSIRQWEQIFSDAGFMVKSERICIPDDDLKWRRTAGTLFLTGTRIAIITISYMSKRGFYTSKVY